LAADLGWVYKYDHKGRCTSEEEIEGVEQKSVPSWGAFCSHWKANYPQLIIPKARKDICDHCCYIFANQHKYCKAKREEEEDVGGQLDEEDMQEQINRILAPEILVTDAAKHVEMAQQRRELYHCKRQEAIATKGLPPSQRIF
jgi:hypothetical protein